MFRSSSDDSHLDPRLKQILEAISPDLFGDNEALDNLDFATIEQRAHDVGRSVARQLCEAAATQRARSVEQPAACPDCKHSCPGSIENRQLLTRDGPIQLKEAEHYCSRCRRAFFPQQNQATLEPSSIQPGGPDDRDLHGSRDSLVRGRGQASADHHRS